jgi:hypothetical protein
MVILAQHHAISEAGLPAVPLVPHVVDVAGGRAAVAAAGPGAAPVAGDDGLADRLGDGVGVALIGVLHQYESHGSYIP